MSSTVVKTYTLDTLAKCGSWGKNSLSTPDKGLLMEMISTGLEEQVENKRYYVSDTDMIERRFLKDATTSFDIDRDSDPFGESKLFDSELSCVYDILGINKTKEVLISKRFLENGSSKISFEELMSELCREHNTLTKTKLKDVNDTSSSYDKLNLISIITGVRIVIEDCSVKIWCSNWNMSKDDAEPKILWIRKVVDGYLGIVKTQKELETEGIWKEVCDCTNYKWEKITIRRKVKEIKDILEVLKIPLEGAKKKNELVSIYCKNVIFPERYLSTISV
jgi:hypothetical protein